MNIWKLKKQCQSDFDSGLTRAGIFEKYAGKEISDKKLATAIASVRDPKLISRYRILNYILVGIMTLLAVVMTFSLYGILQSGDLKATAIVITILTLFVTLIFGIFKNYHQAYLIYGLLTTMRLPTHIEGFGSDFTVNIVELGLALFMVSSLWFLKIKLFPYMSVFGGPKKGVNGNYLVSESGVVDQISLWTAQPPRPPGP
ncbi:hypothetical protein [Gallaecimonas sp. GXIMD4217]|uniref:hypothetical protein n=1 Tax=Gallaecimonas sp. GXIMD4217 TaxID=3131927 RepID=UPI00311AC422